MSRRRASTGTVLFYRSSRRPFAFLLLCRRRVRELVITWDRVANRRLKGTLFGRFVLGLLDREPLGRLAGAGPARRQFCQDQLDLEVTSDETLNTSLIVGLLAWW